MLAHLRKILALISVYDTLILSTEMREALIHALRNPEQYQAQIIETQVEETMFISNHMPPIHFSNSDLLVGTTDHNRPLYVTGECEGKKLNQILVDAGSSINIISLKALKSLALNTRPINPEKITILGFNQISQKSLGSVILTLRFGQLITKTKFHVLDAHTSYKALLGRPWLHENHVVPSTLHQCMKYVFEGKV